MSDPTPDFEREHFTMRYLWSIPILLVALAINFIGYSVMNVFGVFLHPV